MSKFIKRKYSHSTNVVASHDGTLKWKRPHFRLTCAVQKRLCLSSLLGQWCVSLTPNNTKTIERMTCHCFCDQLGENLRTAPTLQPYWTCIKTTRVKMKGVGHFCLIKKTWLMILNSWLRCWAGLYEVCNESKTIPRERYAAVSILAIKDRTLSILISYEVPSINHSQMKRTFLKISLNGYLIVRQRNG